MSGSTVLDKRKIQDLLAEITVLAFMPLLDAFADPGSTNGWLVEAERIALELLRTDASLPLHVTQVCGLAGEAAREPRHLNHFIGLHREVAQRLAAAFARDREDGDATEAGKRLLRFYMSAALHLSVWPNSTDDEVFKSAG